MSKIFVWPVFGLLICWAPPSAGEELSCRQIHHIQKRFLKYHILSESLTPALQKRVLEQFIRVLDREKMYFLQSDIANITKKNKRLFSDLEKRKCQGLYYIYNIYSKRVRERMKFAFKYLSENFSFINDLRYVVDEKLKKRPATTEDANAKMKKYLQYQTANVFSVEKDLKKSIRQVSYIMNNLHKQVLSWKPQLNYREIRECKRKSKNSFKACKPTKWLSTYLNAYSQSLDSHSSYLDNDAFEEFYIEMNLALEGIGATLSSRFGYTVVERLVPGGAAAKSKKIKAQDKILAVGRSKNRLVSIFGERLEDVVSIIRGPKGTTVYLKISRKEKDGTNTIFVVKLVRDRVDLQEERASISYHNIKIKNKNYKVALIKAPSFYGSSAFGKSVTRDVKRLLLEAKKKNIHSLVLDLSYNRGGPLDEAIDLSGLFFAQGNVVKQSAKHHSRPQIFRDTDKRIFYKGPLIVLVNRFSASASEIVSGTLQDYKRAVIVGGDHTFGKGSVQSIEPFSMRKLGALKTTVGLYFTPSGRSTQKEGVNSDIVFPSVFSLDELGEKNLTRALPSQQIKSFKSPSQEIFSKKREENWKPVNGGIIKKLKASSGKRIEKNKKFQKIKKRLAKMRKQAKSRKIITIAEVLENKENQEEIDKQKEESLSSQEKDNKAYFERPDIQEALQIAGELAILQKTVIHSKRKSAPVL